MSRLERKLWGVDARQWLPWYGIYQARKDSYNGKPHIGDGSNTGRDWVGAFYYIDSAIGSFYVLFKVFGVF